ncbi:membrane protein insertase YidC [Rheinheimera sp. SA_1]|jgi:YidC/Oxa1 family membrane protein insertase|uniref:membrane protein insertase YidC n=1 Tax=Rheinheimera sp. SA_1 TaxID=1827365 RepID=UPI000800233E|nr:membrane protein insertase YidC [Rheinheimera sp. SA_1]OBP13328.1 membrane protein insertase YidC [Rheinheimera sp. SA_1]
MESLRSFLVIALALVSFLLWQQWQVDYGPKPVVATQATPATQTTTTSADLQLSGAVPATPAAAVTTASAVQLVEVKTDVLTVKINTQGGDIVGLELPGFTVSQENPSSYQLMRQLNGFEYVAQSGLLGDGPDDKKAPRQTYQVAQTSYQLANGQAELVVPFTLQHNGLLIEKRFIFTAGKYDVRVEYSVTNQGDGSKVVQPYYHFAQTIDNGEGSNMMMPVYRGGAYSTAEQRYEKFSFEDMADANLSLSTKGGWVSMLEHYFVAAWVPQAEDTNQLYSLVSGNLGVIGAQGPQSSIAVGETKTFSAIFYAGPKDQDNLKLLANGLDLTVDYGILWFISQPLFWFLQFIHGIVGNWGIAIIAITLLVKGALFPLTKVQYESMAKMRNLKPKIDELQARYKDDRQKMGPAMMELYRKEKVNPMGGCLPMLIQLPIFLALYWVFVESVELRQAPFMLWITDLSVQDPYYVLPVLYGISMFIMQKLTPMTVTDPMQAKIMLWMPVAFSVFFLWFPSGLVLYWVVSNLVSLGQMLYIYRGMEKKGLYVREAK